MSSNVRTESNNNNNNRPRFAPSNPARREWVPRGHNPDPTPVPPIPIPSPVGAPSSRPGPHIQSIPVPVSALSPSLTVQSNPFPAGIEERDTGCGSAAPHGRHRGNNGGGPRGQSNPVPAGIEERDSGRGSAVPQGRQSGNNGGFTRGQSNPVPARIEERDSGHGSTVPRGRQRRNNGGGPRVQSNPVQPGIEERDSGHGSTVPRGRQRRNNGGGPRVQSNPVQPGIEERDSGCGVGASHGRYGRNSGGGPRGQYVGPMNHFRRERSETQGRVRNNNGNKNAKEASKDSSLPQLLQEIEEKLTTGAVECMICYDMVKRSAPIWSCASCYSIFHLSCIKKWARAPTSADFSTEKEQGVNWRCPGCQSVQLSLSKEIRYLCFCGKRPDPPSDYYLTPHSCGEPCGKTLEREVVGPGESREDLCPHVCVLQCHPGPCPPCKQFAPPRICPCGKKTITTRCSDRKSVLTCGQLCEKPLGCGRHRCERTCHLGPCDQCQVLVSAKCFCKNKTETLLCGEMAVSGEVKPEDGVFSCDSVCGRKLKCGNHFCSDICHPGPCADCELMPSKIKTCHCGKTTSEEQRQSCLDPVSTCSQTCKKPLPCRSHLCEETCHAGKCPPCLVKVSQKCRCTSTSRVVECHKTTSDEKFTCDKSCGRKKSCGRHRCSERCCPLSAPLSTNSGEWDPHLCSMPCGKKKRCGQHSCESLCHSGHCPPCLETIFTDLSCACGRTSIPPPLPCGTPPPSCQLPCSVPQPCGHSASHICHFGDCPPCSVPIAKECVGGHVILRNIPCGSKDITCNKLCGKTRRCGMHACGRTCHQAPCDTTASEPGLKSSCGQTCGAPRRDCRHTCTAQCHPASACPDVRCSFPVTITCSCARLSATVPCDAGGTTLGSYNPDALYEASIIQKLPVPLQPVEATGKRIPLGQRKLTCDDECAKLERKRVLADAFDIGTPSLEALHFGESSAVSELIQDLYRRDPKWVLAVEERCKYLVLGKSRGTASGLRSHVFCPMVKDKRDAIRVIADRWKLTVSAAGWEPKRFIVVHVTPKSKPPPRVIGVKGSSGVTAPPGFDPTVDMDPRLVVSFSDLPREADISALVLRFGGECELVWMNDKNALAVFHDPARAATAMRRLDYGSVYVGAVSVHPVGVSSSAWGSGGAPKGNNNQWKKADDLWGGGEEWSVGGSADLQQVVWKKEAPLAASLNRWTVLEPESASSSSSMAVIKKSSAKPLSDVSKPDASEVAEDWETAYDDDKTT